MIILKRGAILFITIMLIVTFLVFTLRGRENADAVATNGIVIDAGHGTPDGGAVGDKSGVLEKDINLAIAKLLAEKLTEQGEETVLTRSADEGLFGEKERTIREKKIADMKARVSIVNQEGNSLLVSIHMNHFKDASCAGPQIFYAAKTPGSQELAETIRQAFIEKIGEHCTREIKPVTDSLYLLRHVNVPSVLVECGFLSNPKEEALLQTPEYQAQIAEAICAGIIQFQSNR